MKNLLLILGLFIYVSVPAQQVAKSLRAANGDNLGFYQYTPKDYSTGKKYPVIISLHGVGERGNGTTELKNVLGIGIPAAIAAGYDMFVTEPGMASAEDALLRAGLRSGSRVLDVACGSGALSIPAARHGAHVVAADLSPVMIERLTARARAEGLGESREVAGGDGHGNAD